MSPPVSSRRERSGTPSSPSYSMSPPPPRPRSHSSRKRERSQTPSSPDSSSSPKRRRRDLSVDVCLDFKRNRCIRPDIVCKFAHPHSNVTIERDKVTVCNDSLRSKCFRGSTCRYYHPPPHIQEFLLKEIGVDDPKVEEVCKDFLRGRCLRSAENCRFAHHKPIDQNAIVCQDFIRGHCERRNCRYSHSVVPRMPQLLSYNRGRPQPRSIPRSSSMSPRKHERSHTSMSPVKRERSHTPISRGSSPERHHTDHTVEVCLDFKWNKCKRSETDCKFAHPHSNVTIDRDKVMVCNDSLRNKCFRGMMCRYYHPPPHIQESLLKAIGMEDPKIEEVCKDFLRGRCLRSAENCRFAHPQPVDHCAIVCQDFIRGSCQRKSCRFSHVLVAETLQVCKDFLRGKCERSTCRYSHILVAENPQVHLLPYGRPLELPSSLSRNGTDKEIMQVCKDFLKKMCTRDSCIYAHPNSETTVLDNQVEVCRDFRRGVCQRTICRFYHPSSVKAAK